MRPSPHQRHHAARLRADRARKRQRALMMREDEKRQRERAERATEPPPRCVCLPGWCLGDPRRASPGRSVCTACMQLDPELPCLREAQ